MYACGAGEQIEGMSFFDKLKQAGKSLVDSGAKTMLKVCCVENVLMSTAVGLSGRVQERGIVNYCNGTGADRTSAFSKDIGSAEQSI
jgi:hypothetical protein